MTNPTDKQVKQVLDSLDDHPRAIARQAIAKRDRQAPPLRVHDVLKRVDQQLQDLLGKR